RHLDARDLAPADRGPRQTAGTATFRGPEALTANHRPQAALTRGRPPRTSMASVGRTAAPANAERRPGRKVRAPGQTVPDNIRRERASVLRDSATENRPPRCVA